MRWLRDLPIRIKIMLLLATVVSVALLVATTAFVLNEVRALRSSMVERLATLADVLGANSAASLRFDDAKSAADVLQSLALEPEITFACTYDAKGNVFAVYSTTANNGEPVPTVQEPGFAFTASGHVEIFRYIVTDNEPLGTIHIRSKMGLLRAQLTRFTVIASVSLVVALATAVLLSSRLQRVISGPILRLAEAAQTVTRDGDYSIRVTKHGNDELGILCDGFNSMLARTVQITRELNEQRQHALSANTAKSEFLANMSHELRTPLNAIIGFSEVLLEPVFGQLTEKQRSHIGDIFDSGRHLLSLINDILDLAKIEAGKTELDREQVDLPKLLSSSLRLVAERAAKHRIELSLEVSEDLRWIDADQRKLKQVVYNLLSNAVKFTPDGGQVGIRARAHAESVRISVWDTGIGIPTSEHERIFHDFYQVGDPMVKSQQGTGLGLSLVRKLVELHGGKTWVQSEVGVGSEFLVELPFVKPPQHDAWPSATAALEPTHV